MSDEVAKLTAELARIAAANQVLTNQLLADRKLFEMYAAHHEAKDPPDVDKASRNRGQVNQITEAIAASRRVQGLRAEVTPVSLDEMRKLGATYYWFKEDWESTYSTSDTEYVVDNLMEETPGTAVEIALALELESVFAIYIRNGPNDGDSEVKIFPTMQSAEDAYAQSVEQFPWADPEEEADNDD